MIVYMGDMHILLARMQEPFYSTARHCQIGSGCDCVSRNVRKKIMLSIHTCSMLVFKGTGHMTFYQGNAQRHPVSDRHVTCSSNFQPEMVGE